MATASFTKDFTLDSKRAVDSFVTILSTSISHRIPESRIVTKEDEARGEAKLKLMLSR